MNQKRILASVVFFAILSALIVIFVRHFTIKPEPDPLPKTLSSSEPSSTVVPHEGEPPDATEKRRALAKLDTVHFWYKSADEINRVFTPIDPKDFEVVSREVNISKDNKIKVSLPKTIDAEDQVGTSTSSKEQRQELSSDQKFLFWLHHHGATSDSEQMSIELYSSDDTNLKQFNELLPKLKSQYHLDLTVPQIEAAKKSLAKDSVRVKEEQLSKAQGEAIIFGSFKVTATPTAFVLAMGHPISKDTAPWTIQANLPKQALGSDSLEHLSGYVNRETNFWIWGKVSADPSSPGGSRIEVIPYAVW